MHYCAYQQQRTGQGSANCHTKCDYQHFREPMQSQGGVRVVEGGKFFTENTPMWMLWQQYLCFCIWSSHRSNADFFFLCGKHLV